LASAAVFTRLVERVEGKRDFSYRACGYGAGQARPDERMLDGAENAVLDFRYPDTGRVVWFFDHHRTGVSGERAAQAFEQQRTNGQYFFNPDYSSCTKLIADVAKSRFETELGLEELVRWADVIDAARFDGPEQAISRENPILRMMS